MAGRWNDNSHSVSAEGDSYGAAAGSSANQAQRKVYSVAQMNFSGYGGTSATLNSYMPPGAHLEPVPRIEPEVELIAKHIQSIWATCKWMLHKCLGDLFTIVTFFLNNNITYLDRFLERLHFNCMCFINHCDLQGNKVKS